VLSKRERLYLYSTILRPEGRAFAERKYWPYKAWLKTRRY
jgi:hypothetical protein